MKNQYSVSEAEWEILKTLWKQPENIKQPKLLTLMNENGKEWKRQTLNTFLSRLEEKGLVKRENGLVSVVYGEDEYKVLQTQETINNLYDGKLSNFFAAFYKNNAISEEDITTIIQLMKQKNK